MKAGDLQAITYAAKSFPALLPHMISIYKLGYKQAKIDDLKKRADDLLHGINYGNEIKPAN